MNNLTARKVQTAKEPGMYSDGLGLYLCVAPGGTKSWILRTTIKGRRTASGNPYRVEIGLGSIADVSLAKAREEASPLRLLARKGVNPLDERKREMLTFEEAAKRVYEGLLPTWRNEKHAQTWWSTVDKHANTRFGSRPIESITSADVLDVLGPIWVERHETAKRLKQRLSTVFDWARGAGQYPNPNPVDGLTKSLPTVKRRAAHMAAMKWEHLPEFMGQLSERESVSARTLQFIILTAARSGEARGARWSEIDFDERIWTVPADRMKRGLEHRVPLSEEAIEVLEGMRGLDADFVFPAASRDKRGATREQSVMVFKSLLKRMKREGFTVHGFRSTFRDWCSESAHADREVAEASLAHAIGNETERAYARSDFFERRRSLMATWGQFAFGKSGEVVRMVR
ncbi:MULTISPECIES: site-specific integrase [unclassified Roseovarius]|uniref:tyrosine-type recombinase/integrase n=1 Tax=unclassified Roseovarius TaxID=2614913 RepID=UPI00273F5933|nr:MULTISPECIES: site-specific integrase [unclassified Roseovarius]